MKSTVIKYREPTNKKTAILADPGRKRDPLHNLTFARAHGTKQTGLGAFQDLEDFNFRIWKYNFIIYRENWSCSPPELNQYPTYNLTSEQN